MEMLFFYIQTHVIVVINFGASVDWFSFHALPQSITHNNVISEINTIKSFCTCNFFYRRRKKK